MDLSVGNAAADKKELSVKISTMRSNREYLDEQYRDKANLQIRIHTHEKYSHPKIDFPEWVLGLVNWTGNETVLDAGCGSGAYVEAAKRRASWYIAGDLSFGMLSGLAERSVDRLNLDVTAVPLANDTVDVILANHMLYHVPEPEEALKEFHRILRQGGQLVAATNSRRYMPELWELLEKVEIHLGAHESSDHWRKQEELLNTFSLESGKDILDAQFQRVVRHDLDGELIFEEPGPLLAYLGTMRERWKLTMNVDAAWDEISSVLGTILEQQLAERGQIHISKRAGVFVCTKE